MLDRATRVHHVGVIVCNNANNENSVRDVFVLVNLSVARDKKSAYVRFK